MENAILNPQAWRKGFIWYQMYLVYLPVNVATSKGVKDSELFKGEIHISSDFKTSKVSKLREKDTNSVRPC